MDRALLMIVSIVGVVLIIGLLTLPRSATLTAKVVDPCSHCEGKPVCGGKDGKAIDYENACTAMCDGARVIYQDFCAKIPVAHK